MSQEYDGSFRSTQPSRRARILAFLSICLAGFCGGLIGYAYRDLQCTGNCGVSLGFYALAGALLASIGTAVIAILVLRAMEEWRRPK